MLAVPVQNTATRILFRVPIRLTVNFEDTSTQGPTGLKLRTWLLKKIHTDLTPAGGRAITGILRLSSKWEQVTVCFPFKPLVLILGSTSSIRED
jgi:hypothetical protein